MQRLLLLSLLSLLFLSSLVESTAVAGSLSGSDYSDGQEKAPSLEGGNFEFRGLRWGASINDVIKKEGEPVERNAGMLFYKVRVDNKKFSLAYYFFENNLFRAVYLLDEQYTNENQYVDDYFSLIKTLEEKYGKPTSNKTEWSRNLYKDNFQKRGLAYSIGDVTSACTWERDNSTITAILFGNNYTTYIIITYSHTKMNNYINEKNKRKEKEKL